MPLVTLTCSKRWFPAGHVFDSTLYQCATGELGASLPDIITKDGDKLGLDPGTPPDGVQVNYELFHPRAVNTPDGIWMKIEFTEFGYDEETRKSFRDELKRRIEGWFSDHLAKLKLLEPPDFALDMFWAPGNGYVNFGNGTVAFDW